MAANGDRKSTGSNFGCTLRCELFSHSFSQSSSDGTVTSACFAYAASFTAAQKLGFKKLVIRLLCRFKHFGNLQCRDQTWPPPFHVNLAYVPLVCSFRRAEFAPAPAPDFQPNGLTP